MIPATPTPVRRRRRPVHETVRTGHVPARVHPAARESTVREARVRTRLGTRRGHVRPESLPTAWADVKRLFVLLTLRAAAGKDAGIPESLSHIVTTVAPTSPATVLRGRLRTARAAVFEWRARTTMSAVRRASVRMRGSTMPSARRVRRVRSAGVLRVRFRTDRGTVLRATRVKA